MHDFIFVCYLKNSDLLLKKRELVLGNYIILYCIYLLKLSYTMCYLFILVYILCI